MNAPPGRKWLHAVDRSCRTAGLEVVQDGDRQHFVERARPWMLDGYRDIRQAELATRFPPIDPGRDIPRVVVIADVPRTGRQIPGQSAGPTTEIQDAVALSRANELGDQPAARWVGTQ